MRAIPGLTTPDYALSTPAPLPPPAPAPDAGLRRHSWRPCRALPDLSSRQRRPIARHRVRARQSLAPLQRRQQRLRGVALDRPDQSARLTTAQLANDIANELKQKYVKDPKVSIEVETYRPFFILGEVNKPGQYPYVNAMTVEAAVAIAEGYTEKQHMVRLTRKFGGVMSTVMVPPDYPVQPGDTIYVMERFF
jgi:polysaccharide biosynthesis/export protein